MSHDPDTVPERDATDDDRSVFGRLALDRDALRETSWLTVVAVVIAGAVAVTLFHLTRPAVSDGLAPVVEATGGLVDVTLLVNLAFIVVIVGGSIVWFGGLRPRDIGLGRSDVPLGIGITAGTWILMQLAGLTALILQGESLALAGGVKVGDLPVFLAAPFVLGVLFALIYARTGNLFVTIGLHALVNDPVLLVNAGGVVLVPLLLVVFAILVAWPALMTWAGVDESRPEESS